MRFYRSKRRKRRANSRLHPSQGIPRTCKRYSLTGANRLLRLSGPLVGPNVAPALLAPARGEWQMTGRDPTERPVSFNQLKVDGACLHVSYAPMELISFGQKGVGEPDVRAMMVQHDE